MEFREAVAACLLAIAQGLAPTPAVTPSEWGRQHFIVPDGPLAGQRWDPSLTPYVIEPIDSMGVLAEPSEGSVMKDGQSGFSTAMLVLAGYYIDVVPDRMMLIQPTIVAARDFNRDKLGPAIAATPRLAVKVKSRTKDGDGSSATYKSFPGGSLAVVGANSSADLSGRTTRFSLRDETDRYPAFLIGQGDPEGLADARQMSYMRAGTLKRFRVSTPTTVNGSRIYRHYLAGDQRKWFMPCPHCGTEITFEFERLRFRDAAPYAAHYEPECCGADIPAWRQPAMVRSGRWKPTVEGENRPRSWLCTGLISLLKTWDDIAEAFWKSRGDPATEQTFVNLWLGLPFDEEGADIDVGKVVEHAEDYARGEVPLRCARTAFVVDVQDNRLEWALHGFGPSDTGVKVDQWLIEAGIIQHAPDTEAARTELAVLIDRRWLYAGGKSYAADICGIDTGGHYTKEIYDFVRGKRHLRALKGMPDGLPLGTPKQQEVRDRFRRLLYRVPLYGVGTYDLKRWLNRALADLAKGATQPGGLHLPRGLADEPYVRQLAAERLVAHELRNGQVKMVWEKISNQANEALDLAVYARALGLGAHPNGLGLDRLTGDRWAGLIAERHGLEPGHADMFAPKFERAIPAAVAQQAADKARAADAAKSFGARLARGFSDLPS